MLRRTKIIATLGPATRTPEAISAIIEAGVDMVRLNFSHGSAEEHRERADLVREIARQCGRFVSVMADLQGPKLRIARFKDDKIRLNRGDHFIFDMQLDSDAGNLERVGIDYKGLINDVEAGDILLLDDGRMEMAVESLTESEIHCKVLIGGVLSNNKGINRKGGGLSAKALTTKDKNDIVTAANINVDYVAVSFPRSAEDMHEARELLSAAGSQAGLIAKIERAEVVQDQHVLDEIICASEGVMIARGDLAVEIGDAGLVGVQKQIIRRSRTLNRFVITATQMMESMIENPMPTRAEVSDVANAVFDSTDAVMLSAESAVGEYPAEAVAAMARICLGAERDPATRKSKHRLDEAFHRVDEAIALSAMYAANHLDGVKAIICMTETGATPLLMSRIRSALPIFAFSRHSATQNRVTIYRSVHTIPFDSTTIANEAVNATAVQALKDQGIVTDGDLVIITKGDYVNAQGGTNTMKIVRVGSEVL
ncbi:MAG: pyruvate kinase [Pseudomonadales bacterium]|nr:pyruvate kinase [Pseudomonadales bacterium]